MDLGKIEKSCGQAILPNESDSMTARLIVDRPGQGTWNMAVDEVLMSSAAEFGKPTLRFYQWSEPTVSLGYFQKYEARQSHAESLNASLVRRNSGGGAIVHDQELTYSLTVPLTHPLGEKHCGIYKLMHDILIEALSEMGISAELNGEPVAELEKNFLCFQRRANNDVLFQGNKICGSAQRKRHQAISQHGSFILRTSDFAPQIAGIIDLSKKSVEIDAIVHSWSRGLAKKTGLVFEVDTLSERETKQANEIEKGKFGTLNWSQRR